MLSLCLLQGKSALWSHLFAFHVADQRSRANMQQSSADSDHQRSGKHLYTQNVHIHLLHVINEKSILFLFFLFLDSLRIWLFCVLCCYVQAIALMLMI